MPYYEHPNFGDVQNHIFMKGIITSVDSENDLADVTVPGGSDGSGVPLFYHCDPDSEERSNGAIEGASAAFSAGSDDPDDGDEVMVMCKADTGLPVRIIGFVDGIKSCGYWEPFSGDGCVDNYWYYSLGGKSWLDVAGSGELVYFEDIATTELFYCTNNAPFEAFVNEHNVGAVSFNDGKMKYSVAYAGGTACIKKVEGFSGAVTSQSTQPESTLTAVSYPNKKQSEEPPPWVTFYELTGIGFADPKPQIGWSTEIHEYSFDKLLVSFLDPVITGAFHNTSNVTLTLDYIRPDDSSGILKFVLFTGNVREAEGGEDPNYQYEVDTDYPIIPSSENEILLIPPESYGYKFDSLLNEGDKIVMVRIVLNIGIYGVVLPPGVGLHLCGSSFSKPLWEAFTFDFEMDDIKLR